MSNNFMDNANATSVVTAIGDKIKTRDKTFYGTEAQWAALSTAQKKEYDFKATPDGGSKSSMIFADVPVGTILSYGGVSISKEWMLCQGQELLKADYPELYSVIADRFGTASDSNHFKLPDLRGEFLRGSGTNSHANQGNGAAVGAHQDATTFPRYQTWSGSIGQGGIMGTDGSDLGITDLDSNIKKGTGNLQWNKYSSTTGTTGLSCDSITARPTNTSVNFIIKVKNSVDVITDINNYSTEEKVIGVWTDGKPLYQKTVHLASLTVPVNTPTPWEIGGIPIDNLVHFFGTFDTTMQGTLNNPTLIMNHDYSTNLNLMSEMAVLHGTGIAMIFNQTFGDANTAFTNLNATIQYTKTTD